MVALLVLNDHVLKGSGWIAGWATGKLSDVAGLVVAPMLAATLTRCRTHRALVAWHVATGACFALLKLHPSSPQWIEHLGGWLGVRLAFVSDPTDLLTLPALVLSLRWLVPLARAHTPAMQPWRRLWVGLAMAVGLASVLATSPAPTPRSGYDHLHRSGLAVEHDMVLRVLNPSNGAVEANLPLYDMRWAAHPNSPWIIGLGQSPSIVRGWDSRIKATIWLREFASPCDLTFADHLLFECRNRLEVRRVEDGALLWKSATRETVLGEAAGVVLSRSAGWIAREAQTGVELWRRNTSVDPPCLAGNQVYLIEQRTLLRIDPATGKDAARYPLAGDRHQLLCDLPEEEIRRLDTPAGSPLIVFHRGEYSAHHPTSLALLWTQVLVPNLRVVATVDDRIVLTNGSKTMAVSARTGLPIWELPLPSPRSTRSLIVQQEGAQVTAFDMRNGGFLWTTTIQSDAP